MKKAAVFLVVSFFLLTGWQVQASSNINFQIEMLNWKEVNDLLPRYSKFIVLDVETGQRFKVQRRAGSNHADVQPLTGKDTKIMKKIYGGKWSWKRRAIIVIHKNQWIAASMHGMPHGAGALKNNFPGHFCIHFYGSTTHRTNSMDLSHMLMILKAAGKLDEYLAAGNPYEVVNAYIAGFKQQDRRITSSISLQKVDWTPVLKKVEKVSLSRMEYLPPEDLAGELSLDVPAVVDWSIKDSGRQVFRGNIRLVRFSPSEPWKIESSKFLKENNLIRNKQKHLN